VQTSIARAARPVAPGIRETAIAGRFRSISTHQLCLAWWLHTAGHITRRQLRVWFAAHEMHERRRYFAEEGRGRRKPVYLLEELKTLVGGRGVTTADAELTADIRRLGRIGLVRIEDDAIHFATSADQITIEDLSGFWQMFEAIPHQRRSVPVPRRTVRALAGGFSRAVTGVMIALMVRSLFWHQESRDYRIDGRTKGSWIADVFGISRRAVTDARAHLIELGWLNNIETPQWKLNRWGSHDSINVDWKPEETSNNQAVGEGGEIASPQAEFAAEFATPDLNTSPPSERDITTRKLARTADPAGVFRTESKEERAPAAKTPPRLHDIRPEHLSSTSDLLQLYDQAVKRGIMRDCEAHRLNFVALAERARTRGRNPGAMFKWLIDHKRFEFITLADEDAAVVRLREWRNGPSVRSHSRDDYGTTPKPQARALTDDDKLVKVCLQVAQQRQIEDPYRLAREIKKGLTREHWNEAVETYELRKLTTDRFVQVCKGGDFSITTDCSRSTEFGQ
jgi:hypothetical protein